VGTWCPIFRAAAWERGIHIQGNGSPENLKQAKEFFLNLEEVSRISEVL